MIWKARARDSKVDQCCLQVMLKTCHNDNNNNNNNNNNERDETVNHLSD